MLLTPTSSTREMLSLTEVEENRFQIFMNSNLNFEKTFSFFYNNKYLICKDYLGWNSWIIEFEMRLHNSFDPIVKIESKERRKERPKVD